MARLNVALDQSGDKALARVQERKGLNKADVTNRSLRVYDYLDEVLSRGGTILVEEPDGTISRMKIFM